MFFSLFMVGLMVFSMFAYFITSPDSANQLEYGDYEFEYRDLGGGAGVLVTDINGQEIEFQSLPVQVTGLQMDSAVVPLLRSAGQIALSSPTNLSPEDGAMVDYARLQLGLSIPRMFNAMLEEDERYQLPVLGCEQATPQMPVMVFAYSNTTGVEVEGSCIIVNGEARDLMRAKDRIIFEYYDILNDGVVVE
jgi:hypothetical protein